MKKIILAICLALGIPMAAHAEFPDHALKLIVPFPPGSGTDTVARELAEEMSKDLDQPIVIENKPGAQGIIGLKAAVGSAPDGYTLVMLGVTTGASNVTLFKNLPYDPIRDLTPIGMIADSPIVLVSAPQFGPNNAKELFELGRKEPGKLTYGYGSGSAQVAAAKLVGMGGIKAVPVAYKGSPQALVDVMSRQVDFMFVDLSLAVPQIKGGKLKALGVTTPTRFSMVPDIPAINESGAPGYQLSVWFGMGGPAGIPKPVADRISRALKVALSSKKLQEKYATHGLEVKTSTPEEFGEFLKREIKTWGDDIRKAGIPPQG